MADTTRDTPSDRGFAGPLEPVDECTWRIPKSYKPGMLMQEGVPFLKSRGLATDDDVALTEAEGRIPDARPELVSDRALARGSDQCGTLGAGNHFIEVQVVDRVEDPASATAFGLHAGQICVLIHSGSRGLGYQVCDDSLRALRDAPTKYGMSLPDRQLVCAPVESPEGQHYLGAMRAAANYAFCNRQLLMWQVREVFAGTSRTNSCAAVWSRGAAVSTASRRNSRWPTKMSTSWSTSSTALGSP
jgi:RNA-splicing ligase RtcB